MPIDRYYIDAPLYRGERIFLEEEEAHHLLNVTRTRVGEGIEVVNGKNVLAKGVVTATGKGKAEIQIEMSEEFPPPSHEIILAQAMPRLNRLEMILEKGTELGMTKILLFPGERSEKMELSKNQLRRVERILINAMKQCGRLDLPQLLFLPNLIEWKEIPHNAYFGAMGEAPFFSEVWKKEKSTTFFIGPESGFSENELQFFDLKNVRGVKLHHNILRTDTASLLALSLISHCLSS